MSLRIQLAERLKNLLPAQFEDILFQFDMPPALVRRALTQTEQALDLIRYAESQNRLPDLAALLGPQAAPAGGAVFNQSGQSVGTQINIAGNAHFHGDAGGGHQVVQNVTGNGNVFSATGDVRVEKPK